MGRSRSGQPAVIVSATGWSRALDPLLPYGKAAAATLLEHQSHDHIGDLVVISSVDKSTGEVGAFEELVGSHGGLGGDQTKAFVLYPATWRTPPERLFGADAVHNVLKGWLAELQPETVAPVRDHSANDVPDGAHKQAATA